MRNRPTRATVDIEVTARFRGHDFEDIVNLIANRPEIVVEAANADQLTRATIRHRLE